jgi:hypothetical protein
MAEIELTARAGTADFGGAEARPTRRRVLRIVAAAAGLPLMIAAVRATAPKGQLYSWHGEVLDAVSELTLWHTDAAFAQATILKVRRQIVRFERIFSLYRQYSEISRLSKPDAEEALVRASQLIEESQRPVSERRALILRCSPVAALRGAFLVAYRNSAGHSGPRARRCTRPCGFPPDRKRRTFNRVRTRRHGNHSQ